MSRFVISLNDADKNWLSRVAKTKKVSLASVIRQAIHLYQKKIQNKLPSTIDVLLEKTQHTWTKGDALLYQKKIRDEWVR